MSGFLLAVGVRSVLLATLGLAAIALLRRRSASLRHAVAAATLGSMLLLPVFGLVLESRTVSALPGEITARIQPIVVSPAMAVSVRKATSPVVMADGAEESGFPFGTLLWTLGVTMGVLRLGVQLRALDARVRSGKRELGVDGIDGIAVVSDIRTTVPMTAWWGRHLLLFPAEWKVWPKLRLESVVRHEKAHIRRGDWFTQMIGQVVRALFWPNPLVWLLYRQMRNLAEEAADDLVLSSGVPPARYAQDLLEIARGAWAAPVAAVPLARKAEVARRIEMVLNKNKARGAIGVGGLVTLSLVFAALATPLASWAVAGEAKTKVKSSSATKSKGADVYDVKLQVFEGLSKDKMLPEGKVVKGKDIVLTAPAKVAEKALLRLQSEGKTPDLAPTIRVRTDQKASIKYQAKGGLTPDRAIIVVPEKGRDGHVRLKVQYVLTDEAGNKVHIVESPESVIVDKGGKTFMLAPSVVKDGKESVILIEVKPVKNDKP